MSTHWSPCKNIFINRNGFFELQTKMVGLHCPTTSKFRVILLTLELFPTVKKTATNWSCFLLSSLNSVHWSKSDQKMANKAKHKRTKTLNFLKYDNFFGRVNKNDFFFFLIFAKRAKETIIFLRKN